MSNTPNVRDNGIRVLLVLANSFMDNLIPLGVSLLSACLKDAGHQVKLFDTTFYKTRQRTGDDARVETLQVKYTNLKEVGITPKKTDIFMDFKKVITEFKPDLIAVSVVESTYLIGIKLLDSIKGLGVPTLIGGIHVTFSPDEVIKEQSVDMLCVGEGERAIVELANCIRDKRDYSNILNLWVKKDGRLFKNSIGPRADLDKLPVQDWDMYESKRFFKPMGGKIYIAGTFEMNRGCPYNCAFCCNKNLQEIYKDYGAYYREKSVDILMDEIRIKKEKYQLTYLYIVAENFLMMGQDRFDKFIKNYKEIQLPFWIETRPDSVTEDRLLKLRDIGCEGISIGVEHGNEEFRRKVLNRYISNDAIIKAFNIAKKAQIRTCANNIIGFPTETRELIFDTIKLNREIKVDNIIVNLFTPYRGTALRDVCIKKGYLKPDAIAGDYRMDSDIYMPQLPPSIIHGLQRTFAMYVRFPEVMWPDVKRAERLDNKGCDVFRKLKKIYLTQYA